MDFVVFCRPKENCFRERRNTSKQSEIKMITEVVFIIPKTFRRKDFKNFLFWNNCGFKLKEKP